MRVAAALSLIATLVCLGCTPDEGPATITTEIETADGRNPLTTGTYDTLRLEFLQEGFDVVTRDVALTGDSFEIPLDLQLGAMENQVRVRFSGPSGVLHGGPPAFRLGDTFSYLRIVVGPPGTCAVPSQIAEDLPAEFPLPRADGAFVFFDDWVIQLGGRTAEGPTVKATYTDSLWVIAGTMTDLPSAPGTTRAALFGGTRAVVVGEDGGPWTYRLRFDATDQEVIEPLELYPSAGADSALVTTESLAVLVAGGRDAAGAPSAEATFVRFDATVDPTFALLGARADAGAGAWGPGVLVAGGERADGAPWAELVDPVRAASVPVAAPAAEPVRLRPLVFGGVDSAWVVGGVDAAGEPLATSWVVRCTPDCVADAGPELDLGPGPSAHGDVLVDGVQVLRVVETGGWHVEPIAQLAHPREAPGVGVLESGVVLVVGGVDGDGPRGDAELCFPETLNPL